LSATSGGQLGSTTRSKSRSELCSMACAARPQSPSFAGAKASRRAFITLGFSMSFGALHGGYVLAGTSSIGVDIHFEDAGVVDGAIDGGEGHSLIRGIRFQSALTQSPTTA
jgi:hypothetical protein